MKALPCLINVRLASKADAKLSVEDRLYNESQRLAQWYQKCKLAGATRIALQHSNTEPTLVATFPQHYLRLWLRQLADSTQQDCIAVYYPTTRQGELVGKAANGMPFLRDFFVLFDGSRLEDNPNL